MAGPSRSRVLYQFISNTSVFDDKIINFKQLSTHFIPSPSFPSAHIKMGHQLPTHTKKFNTELTDYSVAHHGDTGPYADNLEVDALVVGAGFAGIFMLKTLRDRGYKTVIYEAGNDTGVSISHST
jgi:hypothetical protein